jgi:type I restriction enzyme S subunit
MPDRLWAAKVSSAHEAKWVAALTGSKKIKAVFSVRATGTSNSMKNITKGDVKSVPICFPTLPEQQKIAAFLSSVDRKIEQLTCKKSLLEQYKKGMMQKFFSQELRFKDSEGNDFPDWDEKRLGEVANVNPKASKLPDEFIYIDLESVVSGSLVKESKIQKIGAPSRAQRLLEKGDVLFQMVRPYQKNNYYFCKDGNYIASTGYAQLRAKGSAKFLYQILHTGSFVNKVLARCTGTSYPAINSSDLAKIYFQFPSFPEQQKITDFLSSIDQKIDLIATELDHAKTFKKGLLQQMFV